jgi:hypothetical protein
MSSDRGVSMLYDAVVRAFVGHVSSASMGVPEAWIGEHFDGSLRLALVGDDPPIIRRSPSTGPARDARPPPWPASPRITSRHPSGHPTPSSYPEALRCPHLQHGARSICSALPSPIIRCRRSAQLFTSITTERSTPSDGASCGRSLLVQTAPMRSPSPEQSLVPFRWFQQPR